jgi:hypothetical protein
MIFITYRCVERRRRAAFAAAFTDEADFVAFEGTHLKGPPGDRLVSPGNIRHGRERSAPRGRGQVRALSERRARRDAVQRVKRNAVVKSDEWRRAPGQPVGSGAGERDDGGKIFSALS